MDDNTQPAESPAPSPARGRGAGGRRGGRGRGGPAKRAGRGGAVVRRGGRGGGRGRGRHKTYSDQRVQAAYERQKELRELFSEVAGAAKAGLDSLADYTIKQLTDDPDFLRSFPGYDELQQQLFDRYRAAIDAAETEFKTRNTIATREYELNTDVSRRKFLHSYDASTEDFYTAQLNRARILSELQLKGEDLDAIDSSYTYVEKPDDILKEQGPYVVVRDGIEIPYPHLLDQPRKPVPTKGPIKKTRPYNRRKPEELPDGQPDSKKPSALLGSFKTENGEDAPNPLPRHIGGLLSAEIELDGELESNAPSPTPMNDSQSPSAEPKAEAVTKKKDVPDLPNGASEPDSWGVRTVNRRGPRANNRLIIPPPFEWDDDEIGFRDSTNDQTRKATKATRGKYLNKPNSRNHHLDRTILTYDCLEYEDGDLDPELVKKYNLHPRFGFFLPDSVNEPGPPSEDIDGTKPVVVLTPNGTTLHASRTVMRKKMDQAVAGDVKLGSFKRLFKAFCTQEGIEEEDMMTDELRERQQQRQIQKATEPIESPDAEEVVVANSDLAAEAAGAESQARESAGILLQAAECIETEQPALPAPVSRPSRPYDAVRDVFTNAGPSPGPPPMPPMEVDTSGLSILADMAELSDQPESYQEPPPVYHYEQPVELQYDPRYQPVDPSLMSESSAIDPMIDPRLLGAPAHAPPPPSTFLQTALNPTAGYAPIAPAPVQGYEGTPQAPAGRNPFTNPGNSRGDPVLPPLRPSRRDKGPEVPQGPPPPQHPAQPLHQDYGSSHPMIQTHPGHYYPPAPRPYHQPYPIPDPASAMPVPLQPAPSMPMPPLMPNQPQPPPHRGSYPMLSPPMPSAAQLVMTPGHMGTSSVSPPGPQLMEPSPPGHQSRHRASLSSGSGGGGGGNAAKYRKIAAAPIPSNRPWNVAGGTELRLAHYDHKEAIKDYRANEPPPRTGPTTIRGWNVNNNHAKGRGHKLGPKKEDYEEREPPK
ncbi:hypothetical protein F4780DRAFT_610895 [Xylariomycetidae sp. FL0641]|nr:hypothetical protein F4780DRAFT_610895 [Xylariomycetidae sp. FL0641]